MMEVVALRERALAAAREGRVGEAQQLFDRAAALAPRDANVLNSVGNFHAGQGRPEIALQWFDRALAVAPGHVEALLNRAIVLDRTGRRSEARELLRTQESRLSGHPRYWTARGSIELGLQDPAAAAISYDQAMRRDPTNARAVQGRARASLDGAEPDAVARHQQALAVLPGDPHLLLGLAHALAMSGERNAALQIAEALATQLPEWVDGLEAFAALKWGGGDRSDFCAHYRSAAAKTRSTATLRSWAAMLAGVDRFDEAAAILGSNRKQMGSAPDGAAALEEAIYRGEAGDMDGAEELIRTYGGAGEWLMEEARHRLRTGSPDRAEALLATVCEQDPENVAAWGLRDLCWRLSADDRHNWLHGQPGLVAELPLELLADELRAAREHLEQVHRQSAMPVGQSVKDGSQTTGHLFRRPDPSIRAVARSVDRVLESYRAGLPKEDRGHPLLRHREEPWRITGSWSIRLDGGGRHAPHIHPAGIVSSAFYIVVPAVVEAPHRPGWLELGRPPASLRTQLPPSATIKPREGHCVLFPSTLFHGTRSIDHGQRMTVAFDVGLER
jgi:tetratricopeptide (TPR) repeat protein